MTKIVQTFWNAKKDDILLNSGGYVCPEIHWMSWAFSCLQLRKFYPDVEMYTDNAGKELFELLGLPYTKIHTTLEHNEFMKNCLAEMWAYAKINTYSIQKEPFLHIDGDVFIWKPFDRKLMESLLIAQNVEDNLPIYTETLKIIEQEADYKPQWLYDMKEHPKAHNAGIFGGSDLEFFKRYADLALDFYNKNVDKFADMNKKSKCINLVVEQYLFYVLSKQLNVPVVCYGKDILDQKEYNRFCDVSKVPYEETYLHTLGDFKKSNIINNFISFALKEEYPEYWHRIINIFKEKEILSPFFKHQFQMQEEQQKTITPLIPKRNKDHEATKKLCELLDISFEDLKNRKSYNSLIQDFYDFNEKLNAFGEKTFQKQAIKSVPFPLYKKETSIFDKEDFENYYIFLNPYHQVISSKYNWDKIFSDGTNNKLNSTSPEKYLCLVFIDLCYYSYNTTVLNDHSLYFIEKLRSYPFSIKEIISQEKMDENSKMQFILILKNWLSLGIIYFSKSTSDFSPQKISEVYSVFQQNLKTQVSSCLEQILHHYQVQSFEKNVIEKYDNRETTNTSLIELTGLLNELNFETKAVRGNWESLSKIPLPAIALVKIRESLSFFIVIKELDEKNIRIFNPEIKEEEKYFKKDFHAMWDGILILMLPKS